MQQEGTKKSKKLVWLIAAIAVLLVVAGVVAAVFLMKPAEQAEQQAGPTGPVGGRPDLYWNVDRNLYLGNDESAGLSIREPAEDGLYHIRFAYNGELVEYTFADKRLVNVIDNMDVMGLVFDADGNPIDAVDPTTVATEVIKAFFVMYKRNNTLALNSSIVMNGMQMTLELGELAEVYDVRMDSENPGAIGEPEAMDKVTVFANDKGEVTHVFITNRQPVSDVYWRVGRFYDTTKKETTRIPDENGVYSMTFAHNGEHVTLKCKDKDLVNAIDSKGGVYNAAKGLIVDGDGFILGEVDPTVALRGKLAGSEYHVTELSGNQLTATCLLAGSKESGKSFTVTIPDDCPIYNVCVGGSANMIGEPTTLQMYDRIICYTDLEGKPVLIYMMYRMADSPMYWNVTRMYNDTTKETGRIPDANGYYKITVAVEGKQITVRTKDKAITSKIDAYTHNIFGLELDGDIIKRVFEPAYVSGNDIYGAGGIRFLTDQTGSIMSFVTTFYAGFDATNLVAKPDVEIYDVTGYPGTKIGEKTTINIGDTFRFMADYNNNITHIYVMERYTGEPIYYNHIRMYNTTKASTTRVPDKEGYYVFEMSSRGKIYAGENALKTQDKRIADIIDAQNAPVVALDVDSNGIIRAAYPAATSYRFGYKTSNYHWIKNMDLKDGTYTTIVKSTGALTTYKLAEDCKVYNVSEVYSNFRGEQVSLSSLRPDDRIQAIATKNDDLVREIYIISRKVDSKLYYNLSRKYSSSTLQTTRVPNAEGYYVFDIVVEGQTKQFKTKDKSIATAVDYFNYVPFGMKVDGDIIQSAFTATYINGIESIPSSNYDVTKISGQNVTVTRYLPTYDNIGHTIQMKLAKNCKVWDVSAYAEPFGGQVKLGLGDRGIYYANEAGEVVQVFLWYKNTHEKGHISYCEHCNKNVYWQPYTGTTYHTNGADNIHLYVTSNRTIAQADHGVLNMPESDRTEVILDLNGKTLKTSTGRNFLVYGTLSIVDTVGGGKIMGSTDTSGAHGGAIMIGKGGIVNLYSGTLTENPKNKSNTYGGVLYVGEGGTFNQYGGTIEGGTANGAGGNVYMVGAATYNMYGGTVAGDFAVVSKEAKVNIGGKSQITAGKEGGLILSPGVLVSLDSLTDDTRIVVDAQGVFTEESDNINNYKKNFTSSAPEFAVTVKGNALAAGKLAYCRHCEQEVYWSKFSGKNASGHYIVTEDMEMTTQLVIGACSNHTGAPEKCNHKMDVAIDLNGHTITTDGNGEGNSTGRFALVYGKLSIMDNTAEKKGKIVTVREGTNKGGLIIGLTLASVNLYDGELTMAPDATASMGGILYLSYGSLNMYGGKISDGKALAYLQNDAYTGGMGGNIYMAVGSYVNMYGGVIENGVAENGGNMYVIGTVNQMGGEVKGGITNARATSATAYTGGLGGNFYNGGGKITIGAAEGETVATVSGGVGRCGGSFYNAGTLIIEKKGVVTGGEVNFSGYSGGNIFNEYSLTVRGTVAGGTAWTGGNISDSTTKQTVIDGGIVTGGIATGGTGGNYSTNKNSLLVQNGAEISDGKANPASGYNGGGNIYLINGSLTVTDSTIKNGETTRYGGNILTSNANVILGTGTVIEGGKGQVAGGSICKWNTGDFEIQPGVTIGKGNVGQGSGGTIYMNNATADTTANLKIAGTVNGVLRVATGTGLVNVSVSGDAKTEGLYLPAGYKITVGELTTNADLKVSASGAFTVANDQASAFKDRFSPVDPTLGIIVDSSNQLAMGIVRYCEHCEKEVLWTEFTPAAAAKTGHYIVSKNQTMNSQITLNAGNDVVVDLNGYEITVDGIGEGAATGRFALVYGKLSIQDSSTEAKGKIIAVSTASRRGGLIQVSSGSLNLYSGELTMAEGTAASDRGGIVVCYATFNLYGGKISGGRVTSTTAVNSQQATEYRNGVGGNIYIDTAAVLNMYGGDVVGGAGIVGVENTLILGGNIYSAGGAINIYGGKISGGKANLGGNIYATGALNITGGEITDGESIALETTDNSTNPATVSINGDGGNIYTLNGANIGKADGTAVVTISGGKAYSGGGNIFNKAGTLNIYKGVTVSGGESTVNNGGNISIYGGVGNVYGTVTGGKALDKRGGNIAVAGGATGNIIGGEVTNGEAKTEGGNISTNNGYINLSQNAKVTGGKAVNGGGNIYAWNADANRGVTVTDSEVSGGEAAVGGNIYHLGTAGKLGYVTISNSTISGGKSTAGSGANVYGKLSNITVTKSTISGGVATGGSGGNVYGDTGSIVITDSEITGGQGVYGGNVYQQGGSANRATMQITNSTITGGKATNTANYTGGGNIYLNYTDAVVTGSRVANGEAVKCGGNALVSNASLTLANGTTFEGGTAPQLGPNICKFNSGNLTVQPGATITGGWLWIDNSTSTTANITFAGNVALYTEVGNGPITITVSDAVKVQKLVLNNAATRLTLGTMTAGASINIKAAGVFTNASDKAAEYQNYFHAADTDKKVVLDGQTLKLVAK